MTVFNTNALFLGGRQKKIEKKPNSEHGFTHAGSSSRILFLKAYNIPIIKGKSGIFAKKG